MKSVYHSVLGYGSSVMTQLKVRIYDKTILVINSIFFIVNFDGLQEEKIKELSNQYWNYKDKGFYKFPTRQVLGRIHLSQ